MQTVDSAFSLHAYGQAPLDSSSEQPPWGEPWSAPKLDCGTLGAGQQLREDHDQLVLLLQKCGSICNVLQQYACAPAMTSWRLRRCKPKVPCRDKSSCIMVIAGLHLYGLERGLLQLQCLSEYGKGLYLDHVLLEELTQPVLIRCGVGEGILELDL